MFDRILLICLAIWALIFGIISVTNIEVTWSRPIMGFSALILGVVCIVRIIHGAKSNE